VGTPGQNARSTQRERRSSQQTTPTFWRSEYHYPQPQKETLKQLVRHKPPMGGVGHGWKAGSKTGKKKMNQSKGEQSKSAKISTILGERWWVPPRGRGPRSHLRQGRSADLGGGGGTNQVQGVKARKARLGQDLWSGTTGLSLIGG